MGIQASKRVGYNELRESIPGSLVTDQDFDLFYSLCKVESMRTISTVLHPNPNQLFFVVISGEVHVQLTSPELKNQKAVTATVFTPGETIHFFNLPLKPGTVTNFDFGECVRNGDIKLALHFKTVNKSVARVIGLDRRSYDQFVVTARSNMHQLNSFLGLNVVDILAKSPFFKTITADQAAILGPILKVRLSPPGKQISPYTAEMANAVVSSPKHGSPRSARRDPSVLNSTPAGPIALLLSGTSLSVPYGTNLAPIAQKLGQSGANCDPLPGRPKPNILTSLGVPLFRAPSNSSVVQPIYYPNLYEREGAAAESEGDTTSIHTNLTMHPGILLGLLEYYCKAPRVILRAYLAATPCALGYLTLSALDALYAVDPRFKRVMRRNYFMLIMTWLKPTVPLLRDMDEWSFALLSCKVFVRCYLADSVIYRKGETSDYAYIILGGSVKEVTEPSSAKSNPTGATIERVLRYSAMFGEVALATNSPYFSTTTAREPTMLLALSKRVLDHIYNNNKAKLCEIRIRLMGTDVTLNHVIDHPRGAELFQQYLEKEHAGENLQFYCAVDKFDSMCRDLRRQYMYVMRIREQNIVAIEGARQVTVNVNASSKASPQGASKKSSPHGGTRGSPMAATRTPTNRPQIQLITAGSRSSSYIAGNSGAADELASRGDGKDAHTDDDAHVTTQLTCRDESECNALPNNLTASSSAEPLLTPAGSVDHSGERGSFGAGGSFGGAGSFMLSGKSADLGSHRSMFTHIRGQSTSLYSKPNSMDIGNMLTEDVSSKSDGTTTYSVRSQGSGRSIESHKSEAFMSMHVDHAELASDAESNFGANPKPSSSSGAHVGSIWNLKPPMRKPALESIISESNFSHLDDCEESDLDSPKKFSVKSKPHSSITLAGAAYSLQGSNKIALIEEGDEFEEEGGTESGVASGSRSRAGGAEPSKTNSAGDGSSSVFSESNLKRALQMAVSLAESGAALQPRLSSERQPAEGSGGAAGGDGSNIAGGAGRSCSAGTTAPPSVAATASPTSLPNSGKAPVTSSTATAPGGGTQTAQMATAATTATASTDLLKAATTKGAKTVPAAAGPHAPVFPAAHSPHQRVSVPSHAEGSHRDTPENPAAVVTGVEGVSHRTRLQSTGDEESVRSRNTLYTTNTLGYHGNGPAVLSAPGDLGPPAAAADKKENIALKVNRQLHKIRKDIIELKEVARSIMQTYVYNGAPHQLNLPGTMRLRTEAAFEAWTTSVMGSSNVSQVSLDTAGGSGVDSQGDRVPPAGTTPHGPLGLESTSQHHYGSIAMIPTEVEEYAAGAAPTGATGMAPMAREGSLRLDGSQGASEVGMGTDAVEGETQKTTGGTRGTSTHSGLRGLSNSSYGASFTDSQASSFVSAKVSKLASIDNAEFMASAAFIGSLGAEGQQQAAHPGGTSASMKSSLIPAPIKIPMLTGVAQLHGQGQGQGQLLHLQGGSCSTVTSPAVLDYTYYQQTPQTQPHQAQHQHRRRLSGEGGPADFESAPIDSLDLSFSDLFKETKNEILKLLRDDKFPRWKQTQDFLAFIASVKPYEKERTSGSDISKERTSDKEKSINSYERSQG